MRRMKLSFGGPGAVHMMEDAGMFQHRLLCTGQIVAGAGASTGTPDGEKVCGACAERWPEQMSEDIPVRSVKVLLADREEVAA